jgi:hypothetical protein
MSLCGARKRNGEQCRAFAGQGTDHPGIGNCKFHGGSTRSHRQAAARKIAQRNIAARTGELNIEPVEALLWMVHLSAGQVKYLGDELNLTGGKSRTTEQLMARRLWAEERDRLARFSKAALDAGVAERHVKLAERVGAAIGEVLHNILYAQELALTKSQKAALPDLLRRHLVPLEQGTPVAPVIDGNGGGNSTLLRGSRPWMAPKGAKDIEL